MNKIINNFFAKWSIIVGVLGIAGLIILNIDLANQYVRSDGKTKALFGIIEVVNLPYKYLIGLLIAIEIILAIRAINKREEKYWIIFAISLCLMATLGIFIPLWRIMI